MQGGESRASIRVVSYRASKVGRGIPACLATEVWCEFCTRDVIGTVKTRVSRERTEATSQPEPLTASREAACDAERKHGPGQTRELEEREKG